MKIIEDFKNNIGDRILKNKAKALIRQKKAFNFQEAKTAGILLNATNVKTFEKAQDFYQYLKSLNIDTWSLGYVDDNSDVLNAYSHQIGMMHFTKKELNWYNKPVSSQVQQFVAKEFDILIDLSLEKIFPLQYIVGTSKAKFKTGKFYKDNNYYDLMINIDKNDNLDFFIAQIKHYLSVLKTK